MQDKPEVEDILLRLEEDDEEENKKDAERLMLMNILEDSPMKAAAIDSLSDCTASLDLNDSFCKSSYTLLHYLQIKTVSIQLRRQCKFLRIASLSLKFIGHIIKAINFNPVNHCALFVGRILTAVILSSCYKSNITSVTPIPY